MQWRGLAETLFLSATKWKKELANTTFFMYLSVLIPNLVKLLATETNTIFYFLWFCFQNIHAESMLPDHACFVLFLAHDHESVKKRFVFILRKKDSYNCKLSNWLGECHCLPMLFLLAKASNIFISLIFSLASCIIFHFQDGGDVTNPGSLSPCFLPWKCKSGPIPPSRVKNWLQRLADPAQFPSMSPGSTPRDGRW